MVEHENSPSPEEQAAIDRLLDEDTRLNAYMARAAVLGYWPESHVEATSEDTVPVLEPEEYRSPRQLKPKSPFYPSKVADGDSALDPNWTVTQDKRSPKEVAAQKALDAFGKAVTLQELENARSATAEKPVQRASSKAELDARHAAVNEDWDRIEAAAEAAVSRGEQPDITDIPPAPDQFFRRGDH